MLTRAAVGAWAMANWLILAVIAFLLWTQIQSCRDSGDSKRGAVLEERLRVDTVTDKSDSVGRVVAEQQLNATREQMSQLISRIRSQAPVIIPVGTSHDSVVHLTRAVRACEQQRDSLVESAVQFQSACEAYKDSAKKSLANKDIRYARLDSLYQLGAKGKRVQPYGAALYDLANRRPVFRLGTTTKLLWKIEGMGEAEYSIPSAVKSESGDGLRLLAGIRLKL